MHTTAGADRFEVINGPEDGTDFVITRAPFDIGSDMGCTVNARLDEDVKLYHARASVVSNGYSVRSLAGAPVWVNGKRAGRIRSRVAKDRDIIRIGRTEFMVLLAEGGLASRSYGLAAESDFSYAFRTFGRFLLASLRFAKGLLSNGTIRVLLLLAIILATASFLSPTVHAWVYYAWQWIVYYFQYGLYLLRNLL